MSKTIKRICNISKLSVLPFIFLYIVSCDSFMKLDEDGGYYNEKTGQYKYVFPKKVGIDMDPQGLKKPRAGEMQTITGKIVHVESLNLIWLRIPQRQTYMLLSQGVSMDDRKDKDKDLRIMLKYVASNKPSINNEKYNKQWKVYTLDRLKREVLGKTVNVDIEYLDVSKQFLGEVYWDIQGTQSIRRRILNLWIVHEGLSYYFIDRGPAKQHNEYLKAQTAAKSKKMGLWSINPIQIRLSSDKTTN